jgi:hypothetical protein
MEYINFLNNYQKLPHFAVDEDHDDIYPVEPFDIIHLINKTRNFTVFESVKKQIEETAKQELAAYTIMFTEIINKLKEKINAMNITKDELQELINNDIELKKAQDDAKALKSLSKEIIAPLPFDSIWLEFEKPFIYLQEKTSNQIHGILLYKPEESTPHYDIAILVTEKILNNNCYSLTYILHTYMLIKENNNNNLTSTMCSFINELITHITHKTTKMYIEKQNIKERVGTGKNRALIKIKETILIGNKKEVYKSNNKNHNIIEWTHKWEVRGHWRKFNGIGKNENGKYIVQGWTWVNHYEKGPEDKMLIIKTRLVA